MLPIVLVILVAASTLAAPGVFLNAIPINEAVPPKHNGGIISAYLIDRASEVIDNGDTAPYILTAQVVGRDLANLSEKSSQALALGQFIGLLGSLATGIPGDACAAAEVIDAFVLANRSDNKAGLRAAVKKFINSLSVFIDLIVQVATNPNSQRYATGPRGNCKAGGRTYQFEAAWDYILFSASPSSAGLLNEQYCAAKRLYSALSSRSNNAGAFVTAVSLPPVNRVIEKVIGPLSNFVAAVGSGNEAAAAAIAKNALARAASY